MSRNLLQLKLSWTLWNNNMYCFKKMFLLIHKTINFVVLTEIVLFLNKAYLYQDKDVFWLWDLLFFFFTRKPTLLFIPLVNHKKGSKVEKPLIIRRRIYGIYVLVRDFRITCPEKRVLFYLRSPPWKRRKKCYSPINTDLLLIYWFLDWARSLKQIASF